MPSSWPWGRVTKNKKWTLRIVSDRANTKNGNGPTSPSNKRAQGALPIRDDKNSGGRAPFEMVALIDDEDCENNYVAEPVILFDEVEVNFQPKKDPPTSERPVIDTTTEDLKEYEGCADQKSNRWMTLPADQLTGTEDAVCNHCRQSLNATGECIKEYPFAYDNKSTRIYYHQECYVARIETQMKLEQVHHEFMLICDALRAAKMRSRAEKMLRSREIALGQLHQQKRVAVPVGRPIFGHQIFRQRSNNGDVAASSQVPFRMFNQNRPPPPSRGRMPPGQRALSPPVQRAAHQRREVDGLRSQVAGRLDRHMDRDWYDYDTVEVEGIPNQADEKLVRVRSPQRMIWYDDLGNVKSESFERSGHSRSIRGHRNSPSPRYNNSYDNHDDYYDDAIEYDDEYGHQYHERFDDGYDDQYAERYDDNSYDSRYDNRSSQTRRSRRSSSRGRRERSSRGRRTHDWEDDRRNRMVDRRDDMSPSPIPGPSCRGGRSMNRDIRDEPPERSERRPSPIPSRSRQGGRTMDRDVRDEPPERSERRSLRGERTIVEGNTNSRRSSRSGSSSSTKETNKSRDVRDEPPERSERRSLRGERTIVEGSTTSRRSTRSGSSSSTKKTTKSRDVRDEPPERSERRSLRGERTIVEGSTTSRRSSRSASSSSTKKTTKSRDVRDEPPERSERRSLRGERTIVEGITTSRRSSRYGSSSSTKKTTKSRKSRDDVSKAERIRVTKVVKPVKVVKPAKHQGALSKLFGTHKTKPKPHGTHMTKPKPKQTNQLFLI